VNYISNARTQFPQKATPTQITSMSTSFEAPHSFLELRPTTPNRDPNSRDQTLELETRPGSRDSSPCSSQRSGTLLEPVPRRLRIPVAELHYPTSPVYWPGINNRVLDSVPTSPVDWLENNNHVQDSVDDFHSMFCTSYTLVDQANSVVTLKHSMSNFLTGLVSLPSFPISLANTI
jgi:hypothetical protein